MKDTEIARYRNPNPTTEELETILRMGEILAKSSIVPRDYQGKPENVVAAGLIGRPFGWDATTAMRMITVIQGMATIKPEAILSLIRRDGHSVSMNHHIDVKGVMGVTVLGKRFDNGDEGTATFTISDAERAGLLRNGTWKQYPSDMCQWRAVSRLSRQLFSDVVLGAGYTPEEIALSRGGNEWIVERSGEVTPRELGVELTDEVVPREWLTELEKTDDLDELRKLHFDATFSKAGSDITDAIAAKGLAVKAAAENTEDTNEQEPSVFDIEDEFLTEKGEAA